MPRLLQLVCIVKLLAICFAGNCLNGGGSSKNKNTCRSLQAKDICFTRTLYYMLFSQLKALDQADAERLCKLKCLNEVMIFQSPLHDASKQFFQLKCNEGFNCIFYSYKVDPVPEVYDARIKDLNLWRKTLDETQVKLRNAICQKMADVSGHLVEFMFSSEKENLYYNPTVWRVLTPVAIEALCQRIYSLATATNGEASSSNAGQNNGEGHSRNQNKAKGKEGTNPSEKNEGKAHSQDKGKGKVDEDLDKPLEYYCKCRLEATFTSISMAQAKTPMCSEAVMLAMLQKPPWQPLGLLDAFFVAAGQNANSWMEKYTSDWSAAISDLVDAQGFGKVPIPGVISKPSLCSDLAAVTDPRKACPGNVQFGYKAGTLRSEVLLL